MAITFNKPIIIAIDGGPLSGKTSSFEYLKNTFTHSPIDGVTFLFSDEAATKLFEENPDRCGGTIDFQFDVMKLQIKDIEKAYRTAESTDNQVILLCDRTLMSSIGVYLSKRYNTLFDFKRILQVYDAVFYFDSAVSLLADTKAGNAHRRESMDEIKALSQITRKTLEAHPSFFEIPVFNDIRAKYDYVQSKIINFINNTSAKSEVA